jgi:predicted esterase
MARPAPRPIVKPAPGKHTATVICAHGLGDSGAGWSFLPDMIGNPWWIKFVFPNAPSIPITVNGGMAMPGYVASTTPTAATIIADHEDSWYDIAEVRRTTTLTSGQA